MGDMDRARGIGPGRGPEGDRGAELSPRSLGRVKIEGEGVDGQRVDPDRHRGLPAAASGKHPRRSGGSREEEAIRLDRGDLRIFHLPRDRLVRKVPSTGFTSGSTFDASGIGENAE